MASTSDIQMQQYLVDQFIHNCKCKYSLGANVVQAMQYELKKIIDKQYSNHIFQLHLNRFNVFWHEKLMENIKKHPNNNKINSNYEWQFGCNINSNNNNHPIHNHHHYHNTYNVKNIEHQSINGSQNVHNQTIQKQTVNIQHITTQINAIEHISLVSRKLKGKYKIKCLEKSCERHWSWVVTYSNGSLRKAVCKDHNAKAKHGGSYKFICVHEEDNGIDDDIKCGQELSYPRDLKDRRVTHINGEPISKYTKCVRLTCCALLIHLHSHEISEETDEETDESDDASDNDNYNNNNNTNNNNNNNNNEMLIDD